jgi:hypothetical protein
MEAFVPTALVLSNYRLYSMLTHNIFLLILGVGILLRLLDQGEDFPSTQRYYSYMRFLTITSYRKPAGVTYLAPQRARTTLNKRHLGHNRKTKKHRPVPNKVSLENYH